MRVYTYTVVQTVGNQAILSTKKEFTCEAIDYSRITGIALAKCAELSKDGAEYKILRIT